MTLLEFFKTVHPSVLAAKMIFKHLQEYYPVLKIADIADTTSGGTPNRGMSEYYNGEIPWVKSGELKDGVITTCEEYITEAGLKNSSAKLFPKGTLLVAMYGANIGKTGVLDFDATTNQAVCAIFPKIDISREYLYWYFKQQRIDFIAVGKGGAQPNISQTIINNTSIVVPDVNVQDKIVKFLERIEKGDGINYDFFIPEVLKDIETIYKYKNSYVTLSDSVGTQLTQIDNLNQAILQESLQGKLVPQDPNDEPASELLKRIEAEKAKLGKKGKSLPPIKPEEIPFEIPENWVWCRFGDIVQMSSGDGLTSFQMAKSGTIPVYGGNGINGYHDKANIERETIVIGRVGYYCGCVHLTESKAWVTDNAFVLRYSENDIDREFLIQLIKWADLGKQQFAGSQPVISGMRVYSKIVPLPPLLEQRRIVTEIGNQFAKTKQLKEHIYTNQQATEKLLKALLHQAFEVK